MAMYSIPSCSVNAHGLFRLSFNAGPSLSRSSPCSPVPATVLTVWALRSRARIRLFLRSATYSVSPSKAKPCGSLKRAFSKGPSVAPD